MVETLSPDEGLYTVTGAYTRDGKVQRNEAGYRGYLAATSKSRPNPGPGYCARALAQAMGIPSPGHAYQWASGLADRGWKMREGHIAPYDVIVYHNRPGSTYRGYSDNSKDYFGHVGIAVPNGTGGVSLYSYLNGKWQHSRLGKGWVAMYPGD